MILNKKDFVVCLTSSFLAGAIRFKPIRGCTGSPARILFSLFFLISSLSADTWTISSRVEVTVPRDVEDVVVTEGGHLIVSGVGEPGFRISGNLIVEKTGLAEFRNSVIKVMSRYHGQYILAAREQGRLVIDGCQYQVPYGVQHAVASLDTAQVEIKDTRFNFLQLVPLDRSRITASRLTGDFECVVSDSGRLELADIPSQAGAGSLWVWPTFMPGTTAVYSPPLPGYVDHFVFPPANSSGIEQSFQIDRCAVRLWPLLVRENTTLTLAEIPEENRVVVGLYLPQSTTITGLTNRLAYEDQILSLEDRTLRLSQASIDTWNLYPVLEAQVAVRNCLIGELLAGDSTQVDMEGTIVDGTGGYLGVKDSARLTARGCLVACDVQAIGLAGMTFHHSLLLPYFSDTTGAYTFFRVFDTAFLHLDQTLFQTIPVLGGRGAIAFTYILNAPPEPPVGTSVPLTGYAAVYSLDPKVSLLSWSLRLYQRGTHAFSLIGGGVGNVENGYLGTWQNAAPDTPYELRLTLRDSLMRKHEGRIIYY